MTKRIVKWTMEEAKLRAVETISLVEDPAIEEDFLVFSKENLEKDMSEEEAANVLLMMAAEEEAASKRRFEVPESRFEHLRGQNLIFAPIMIADKLIARADENGELFYGYFPAEEIRKAAYFFTQNKMTDSFNIEHNPNNRIDSVSLVESWIVEDSEVDKAYYFGYNLEPGSWVGFLRINDEKLLEDYIKTGTLKGVSVEAYLVENVIFSKATETGETSDVVTPLGVNTKTHK